jgi:hypothetical protein
MTKHKARYTAKSDILVKNDEIFSQASELRQNPETYVSYLLTLRRITEQLDEVPLMEEVKAMKLRALIVKRRFLDHDLYTLKKDRKQFGKFLSYIMNYYWELCLFPDEEIKDRFKSLGIPAPVLKWMIPMDQILSAIMNISRNEDFIFFKQLALKHIEAHLHDKINGQIIRWGNLVAKDKSQVAIKKESILIFRRLNEGGGKLKKIRNEGEGYIQEWIHKVAKEFGGIESTRKLFLNKVQGKTEGFHLRNLVTSNIVITDITEESYLCCVFNLFKLICKDKILYSEKEFEEERIRRLEKLKKKQSQKEVPKNRRVISFYDGDYDFYCSSALKKLILKK